MCTGHPRIHPCGHVSMTWEFCNRFHYTEAHGSEPCDQPMFCEQQYTEELDCPITLCDLKNKVGGIWKCCQCGRGPNSGSNCGNIRQQRSWNERMQQFTNYEVTCEHMCCPTCPSYEAPAQSAWFHQDWNDLGICAGYLGEFQMRLSHADKFCLLVPK